MVRVPFGSLSANEKDTLKKTSHPCGSVSKWFALAKFYTERFGNQLRVATAHMGAKQADPQNGSFTFCFPSKQGENDTLQTHHSMSNTRYCQPSFTAGGTHGPHPPKAPLETESNPFPSKSVVSCWFP